MSLPLAGIVIADFSQFLAGPFAALRLQDLGARVIKVENPRGGDLCRRLYLTETLLDDGDSTLFHAINRGKESITLDLKTPRGIAAARQLAARADIVIQNFRPGVIERLGLDHDTIRARNPGVVYGSISGYGRDGPWRDLPGQDLLAQARSGLMWLSGNRASGPVPVGLPLADMLAGATLAQGLLAALFRKATQGIGAYVETSLLECLADAQFEFLTTYLNSNHAPPERAAQGSAHVYLGAPYGVYDTADGQLALAMTPLDTLAELLQMPALATISERPGAGFAARERIRAMIAERLRHHDARHWERHLGARGVWCARVLTWDELMRSETFRALDMVATYSGEGGSPVHFLRPPLSIDHQRPEIRPYGPRLNAQGDAIATEFALGTAG